MIGYTLAEVEYEIEKKKKLLKKDPNNGVLKLELKQLQKTRKTLSTLYWINHMSGGRI